MKKIIANHLASQCKERGERTVKFGNSDSQQKIIKFF